MKYKIYASSNRGKKICEHNGVSVYERDGYYYIYLDRIGKKVVEFPSDKEAFEYIDNNRDSIQT